MTRVYRIMRAAYARAPFDGEGAYRFGGRWSSPGTRLSYTSEHQSLAMLEYFVRLDPDDPPDDLVLATADVSDRLTREYIEANKLPANWREIPAPPELAGLGDDFVQRAEHCLLLVPSALAVSEKNWLINPRHPDFKKIVVRAVEPLMIPACFPSTAAAASTGEDRRQREPIRFWHHCERLMSRANCLG